MTEEGETIELPTERAPGNVSATRVRTLLVCDLANSTALVERLGDAAAAGLLHKHDRVARDLLRKHSGREIDKTDGFLLLFERPIEAVAFALAYQRALHALGEEAKQPLRARVGIHVGEVVLWENNAADVSSGAKPLDVEGLAKPVVARLMALALPGQILLSGVAFGLAQRVERELNTHAPVRWLTHGRYRFKGVAAAMLVHEVGESGFAPLQAPPSGAKAQRDLPLWRKPLVLTLEGIALLVAVAVPVVLSLRAPPAIAFGERDWIVMGELRNLTGQSVLDESLSTAFRISLEQSRYVNVLPDLKLRDALARMQRAPDTAIDRAVASEIALREGARAVILPTVAEIGGRVRVSAEVIDPQTQTTVYAESADGVGAVSALDSIDTVTNELRAKLGEALKSIENDSAPLPQVTSGNLDALRAYALGLGRYAESKNEQALELFNQALALDPEFALAHVGKARVLYVLDELDAAKTQVGLAAKLKQRLTARDAMYVEAWRSTFGATTDKLAKWRLLGEVYPDYFAAHYNHAMFALFEAGRFEEALVAVAGADAEQNPMRDEAIYLRATSQLALDRIDLALESFHLALGLGADGRHLDYAFAEAARHNFAAALKILEEASPATSISARTARHEAEIVLAIDQGRLDHARKSQAPGWGDTPAPQQALDSAGPTLIDAMCGLALGERAQTIATLESALGNYAASTAATNQVELDLRSNRLLLLAYLAARLDAVALTKRALALAAPIVAQSGIPVREDFLRVVEAELLRATGQAEDAVELLNRVIADSNIYQAHSARLRSYRALGRTEDALAEADWLATHRGHAYVGSDVVGQARALNLADANLAAMDAAEIASESGQVDSARKHLTSFAERWPEARNYAGLRTRMEQVERRLAPSPDKP